MKRISFVSTVILLLLLCGANSDAQQQFGKNKVQYRNFDWKYIQTEHFDIYFYDTAGVYISKFAAQVAESALASLQDHWHYRINSRISLILYNSHNDFQQTNVVDEYMPEGVGGVTELYKNRMVLPFEGEWEKFRHVIHHELTHAVLNDKFYGGSIQSIITNNVKVQLPIWMNEGLAEFESLDGYDIATDMFIRDAVIGGYLPNLEDLNGFFAYRGGQAFYWYVEQTYGRQKIAELLNRVKASSSIEAAFKGAFGKTLEEFSEQWKYDLKKIYWPDIADRKRPTDFPTATLLTNHKKEHSFYNTSPAISPNGDKLAYISDKDDGLRSVYVMNVETKEEHKLAQGESNVNFEELHLITPAIAWSPDSKRIALAVKSHGYDAIFIIDVTTDEQQKIQLNFDGIYSVDWSPDGTKLAFQGIKGESSDIYTYELATKKLVNVTDDIFTDTDPNWANDNKTIYFVSDRRDNPVRTTHTNFKVWNYSYNSHDIFSLNTESYELKRITSTDNASENSPTPGPNGRLLYISDANGITNIYALDSSGKHSYPLTNSISEIEQLSLTRDASRLVFTAWNTDGFDVVMMRMPFETKEGDTLPKTQYLKKTQALTALPDSAHGPEKSVNAVTPISGYGDVKVDVSEAAPPATSSATSGTPADAAHVTPPPTDSRTTEGDYAIKDYKVKFSPDLMLATGNYSSFYGVQGVAQMLFSDMLGNHQIFVSTNLQLDLKNSNFVVSYSYLPERVDYSVDLFQYSALLALFDANDVEHDARFRQYGITGRASNPFDRFTRLEFGLTWLNVLRESLFADDPGLPDQTKTLFVPSMSYIFDNTENWAFGPVMGSRYNLTASASPKLGASGVGFYTLMGDLRHYINLGSEYSIAARAVGGFSFGPNPQKFFIGGVENWLNYSYAGNAAYPIQNAEDFSFLTPGYPLRGYDFNVQNGSKYFIGNLEFRFPLFRALVSGPLPVLFQYVAGAIFADVGSAWNDNFTPFVTNPDGTTVARDLLMGTGIGARAYVFGIPARLDVAWNYNLSVWSPPKYYISLGYDF